jgi:hypothetical protein
MSSTGWTPRTVPYGADQTVYLVIDRFGGLGTVYRETEVERADLETIITDLMSGQFNDPIRVVAFNTLERRTSQNISPSKFKLGSISNALVFPSISATLSPATPVRPGNWPCGWFDRCRSPGQSRQPVASRPPIPASLNRRWRRRLIRCRAASAGARNQVRWLSGSSHLRDAAVKVFNRRGNDWSNRFRKIAGA